MGVGIRAVEAGPEKDGRWEVAATEVATVAEAIQQAIRGRIRYGKYIMYVWGVIKDMLKCDVVVVVVDILERGGGGQEEEGRGRRAEGGEKSAVCCERWWAVEERSYNIATDQAVGPSS